MTQRDYRFDNLKLLLIFLVVFGHMLELMTDKTFTFDLYMAIYTFHMPAFVFVSGYFARFSPKKIISRLLVPYIVFQVLYITYANLIFGTSDPIQFTTPYWLMWYMLVMVLCYALIPFLDIANTSRSRIFVIALLIIMSLLIGFDNQVGRFLTLSRLFDFLPYFTAGYYIGTSHTDIASLPAPVRIPKPVLLTTSLLLSAIGIAYVVTTPAITPDVLYGASSYELAGDSPPQKLALYLVGASIIVFLLFAVPSERFPILSSLGAGTLSIYILHGFIIRALCACPVSPFIFDEFGNLVLALIASSALVAILGATPVARAFSKYATGRWVEELIAKKRSNAESNTIDDASSLVKPQM